MARPYALTLAVPLVASTDGAAVNVSELTDKVVQLHTYGTGTFQVQVSADGTNWTNYGAAFSAVGVLPISFHCHSVRIRCTSVGTSTSAIVAGVQQPS